MVAYSFQRQFVAPIRSRLKRQTLRNERKRHARVGEELQLYSGMRTRHCELIGFGRCLNVEPIRLCFVRAAVVLGDVHEIFRPRDLDQFAREDGFGSWPDLERFWLVHHHDIVVGQGVWSGVRITWGDTFQTEHLAEAA